MAFSHQQVFVLLKRCSKILQMIVTSFTLQAQKETGKSQFPYMKDPNTGKSMLESDAIVKYLFTEYGDGVVCHNMIQFWEWQIFPRDNLCKHTHTDYT